MNAYDVIIAIIFSIALIVIIWILVRGKPGGIDGNMNLSQEFRATSVPSLRNSMCSSA